MMGTLRPTFVIAMVTTFDPHLGLSVAAALFTFAQIVE